MKYIAVLALLGFGALSVFLLFQSRSPQTETLSSAPVMGEHQHPGMGSDTYSGRVIETMDAGGYTYVRVDGGHEKVWAAGPLTEVEVGDEVSFLLGMEMTDFTSETLDRKFDSIYFVPAINPGIAGGPPPSPHARVSVPVHEMDYTGIDVPSDGIRIDAVYDKKDNLGGKEVVVRGKVVKFTPGVMDKNWIHLRDGSGADGTNDLAVTTNESVRVGDIIVVRGTLGVDKDFGFGYSYQVIVENATVMVEQ